MARYQLVEAAGGVTASWATNQASETNRPYDWSIVKRGFFCCILEQHLVGNSQRVEREVKEKKW